MFYKLQLVLRKRYKLVIVYELKEWLAGKSKYPVLKCFDFLFLFNLASWILWKRPFTRQIVQFGM